MEVEPGHSVEAEEEVGAAAVFLHRGVDSCDLGAQLVLARLLLGREAQVEDADGDLGEAELADVGDAGEELELYLGMVLVSGVCY